MITAKQYNEHAKRLAELLRMTNLKHIPKRRVERAEKW